MSRPGSFHSSPTTEWCGAQRKPLDPLSIDAELLSADADVEQIVVVGLALDFCVRQSVSDAVKARKALGKQWDIVVVREGVKSVDPNQEQSVIENLQAEGVRFIGVQDLLPA